MTSRKILVVEDNPLTRKMLRITLESDGYSVIEAADGRAAIAAAEQEVPALVLQDLILPDMNGFELMRQLRALGAASTPIIALSGFLNRVEDARHAATGFTALLVKPVEPSRLLEVIRPYFPAEAEQQPFGKDCRVLVVDADRAQRELTRMHLKQLGFEVMVAASTLEALRIGREAPPDVVLSDTLMPKLDGFQLCFQIRKDPHLQHVPVVLASARYETSADRQLAAHVGATALIQKTPDLKGVPDALLEAVRRGGAAPAQELSVEVRLEHAQAVIRQLEKQLAMGDDLTRRCALQAAQIALLSGVADALAMNSDADLATRDVLAATLDAAGISKGALFLRTDGGPLELRHAIGFSSDQRAGLPGFFEHRDILEDAIARQAAVSIPSLLFPEELGQRILTSLDAASAQIVPLISKRRGVGVMVLCARRTDVTNEDSIAFARAMGNQLAQSLDLASSFAQLTASERRYRAVTEAAHDAISILTLAGEIIEVNPSFEAMLGLPRERIVGRRLRDLAAAGQEGRHGGASNLTEIVDESKETALSLERADGSIVLVEFRGRPVETGGEKFVVCIGRDVTERVKTQAQLMFSDRMASIGTLAAGVAHEINNPLTAAVANLEFAIEQAQQLGAKFGNDEVELLQELLRDASEGTASVRTIVRDLKIFSRAEEDHRGPVDVERVLESALRMAWNEIRHRAELVREYSGVPPAEGNEARLGQVFLNLIVNAAQALPDGNADENKIFVRTRSDASGRILAEVEDTGPGIPPEILPRLFTPFFTTKPRGVGTGLGLSICKRIVSSLNGEISVDSVVGRGTRFTVRLLPSEVAAKTKATATPHVAVAARRGRVLVVDDDEMSARAVSRVLSEEHDVAVFADVNEALERIAEGEDFDVIICDLMMPVKTGVDFYDGLAAHSPSAAEDVIFLTGGAFTVKTREFLDRVPNVCMEKPFEAQALRALVNDHCSRKGRSS